MKDNQKKWAQLVAKAWIDENFKKELLSNPKKVLEKNGMTFDKHYSLKVIEPKKDELCIILPHKPEGNLSEIELKNIAASGDVWACTQSFG